AGLKFNQVVMQGMNRVAFGYLPDYVLRPALLILAIPFLITDPISAMGAHVSAAVIALAVSFVLFWRVLPPELFDTQAQVDHSWLPGAFPFMLISGFSLINIRGGTALVGMISDMETVALYGASVRVGGLIALTLAAVSAVAAPRIAALFASGDMDSLQRLVARSARGITVIAVPVAAFLIVFGRRVLTLYGPGFVEAHPALIVISLGQIINAATGVVGWVMIMTGHEWAMAKILIATVLAHLVLIGILTPFFGVTGAAVATAFANVLLNISLAVYSISRIGINPTILPFKLSRS
nr:polysaccharide biosynthesis C-terminal domain-containing protein [Anaerolineae bacterium]